MRKLVPQTLGATISRRYKPMAWRGLSKPHGLQTGYANTAKPLVWRTVQRAPETTSLGFLRRRLRFSPAEDVPMEDSHAVQEQPKAVDVKRSAPRSRLAGPIQADQVGKIQRKTGPSIKGTVIELPKSPPPHNETEIEIKGESAHQEEGNKQVGGPQPVPQEKESPKSGAKPGASKMEKPASKRGSGPEAKPERSSPTNKPAIQLSPQPEAPRPADTGPIDKPYIARETTADTPTLINGREEKPVQMQKKSKESARRAAPRNRDLTPESPPKATGKAGIKARPKAIKPARENTNNQASTGSPPANAEASPTQVVQRKPAKEARSPQQSKSRGFEKAPEKAENRPGSEPPSPQPETKPKPAGPDETTPTSQRLAKANANRSSRPLVSPSRLEPRRPLAKPAAPKVSRQTKAGSEKRSARSIQRRQAQPAELAKASGPKARPAQDEVRQEIQFDAKPVWRNTPGENENRETQPPARNISGREWKEDLPIIVHSKPLTALDRPYRQPELPSLRNERKPEPDIVQRQTEPAEAPTSSQQENVDSPSLVSTPTGETVSVTEEKPEDNAKVLDEMAQQVYQIIQRRLRVEFERSQGLKI